MSAWRRHIARLRHNPSGVATIEFAIVAPVFLMVIVGAMDIGQMFYAAGVLDGAVERAARSSTLETGNLDEADAKVSEVMSKILPHSEVSSTRRSYFDFTSVKRHEPLEDTNSDDLCSPGERFSDENNNGVFDDAVGSGTEGNGGANDVIIYTVNVRYTSIFAMPLVPLDWSERELTSTTVKRNQPFALQDVGVELPCPS